MTEKPQGGHEFHSDILGPGSNFNESSAIGKFKTSSKQQATSHEESTSANAFEILEACEQSFRKCSLERKSSKAALSSYGGPPLRLHTKLVTSPSVKNAIWHRKNNSFKGSYVHNFDSRNLYREKTESKTEMGSMPVHTNQEITPNKIDRNKKNPKSSVAYERVSSSPSCPSVIEINESNRSARSIVVLRSQSELKQCDSSFEYHSKTSNSKLLLPNSSSESNFNQGRESNTLVILKSDYPSLYSSPVSMLVRPNSVNDHLCFEDFNNAQTRFSV